MRHDRRFPFILILLVATLLLAACGGDDEGADEGDAGEGEPGRAVVAQGVDPTTMDPHQHRETTTANVLRHFYDPLVERDPEDPTEFRGVLAESWERVDDNTMEFRLKEGVTFSGGEPFDAEAVRYNIERLLGQMEGREPALQAFQFQPVERAEVVDEHTVRIITNAPDPVLLSRMAQLMMIAPGSVDDDPEALASEPNGTGPYTLQRWDRNNQVVAVARDEYHGGDVRIDEVVFRTMPEASTRLAAIRTGDVDVITNVPPDNIPEVEQGGNAEVESVPSARVAAVWLNTLDNEALASREVRQALNYAVDAEGIIETVMGGYGERIATIVAPYFTGYADGVEPYPHDPDRARELLREAGHENLSLQLMVPRGRYLLGEEIVQAVVSQLGEVGVNVQIQAVEFGVFAEATQQRDIPDAFYAAWGNAFFNPVDMLQTTVVTGEEGFSWYSNERVDELTAQAASTLDDDQHADLLGQVQEEIREDPPFIFLFAYEDLYGVSNRLEWTPRSDELIYLFEASLGD
jgi:peptide/nickel transport system substrate-binding protein